MANNSTDTRTRTFLFDMAAAWTKLAVDLEHNEAVQSKAEGKSPT
jgi:hypothetical protein